jgi:UMF1 family MFS transporter
VAAPLLGAFVAARRAHRSALTVAVATGAVATAALSLAGPGSWRWLLAAYTIAFLAFSASFVVYDGLLVAVAEPEERDRVSARGFAWGYAGGGLLLAVHAAWLTQPRAFGFEDAAAASRVTFASVAVWWAVFALPLLRAPFVVPAPFADPLATAGAWERLRSAIRDRAALRPAWTFLLAFWLYNDAVGTVVKMATIYGASLGFGTGHLVGALLLVQAIAIPATLAAGALARRIGARTCILGAIGIYACISVIGYGLSKPVHFWVLAACVGLAQGGVQALSRSYFAALVPAERATEMFGFYNLSARVGGVLGTFLFAAVSQWTGTSRYGSLALLPLLVAGALLLLRVPSAPRRTMEVASSAQT